MITARTAAALRAALSDLGPGAFVPTMGNLHRGHLDLIAAAKASGRPVVASVFVNRLQFLPHEDFDRYPRTAQADAAALATAGCDLLFTPDETEFYPEPQSFKVTPDPQLADILEGAFRPGFFTGVCTVVMKLLQLVRPAVLVLGRKDYQQLAVLRAMVRQFALEVQVLDVATARAEDGLALSSRNGFLTPAERAEAPALAHALSALAHAARTQPGTPLAALEAAAVEALRARGWQPHYLTVRRRSDLLAPSDAERAGAPLVALGAAVLGSTRLIDNLEH